MSDLYNHLPEDFDFFTGEPLSEEVWRRKYRHTAEDNFADTARRVVNGVYVNDSTTEQQLAYDAIRLGLWMPGGRILAGAGTNKRVTLFNCFDELELLMTRDGIMDFHDAQGPTEVLTQKGWIEADIRRFGIQKVHKYTFVPCTKDNRGGRSQYRREVLATPDHRWILTSGKETTALDVGMRVPACAYTGEVNEAQYRNGFKHGIVFGDGTHTRTTLRQVGNGYPLGTMHFAVRLCGAKADYLPWFEGENITYPPSSKGDPHVFLHTMEDLKAVPTTEKSPDYIKGFIDGWAAMDGGSSVAGEHSKAIFSKNRAALDWLCAHAPFAGYIPVGNRRFSSGETNYGGKGELWVVTIREVAYVEWECVGIAEYGDRPVMCAVVPEEAAFTLVGGIYTGNCYVNETIEDSMEGIHRGFGNVMFTMQQGGGIGTDFTPIRPNGAWLSRTQAPASGPIPFAIAQDAIGQTVESAGERRGAQMGTLADFHPDLPAFISAKHTAGVLTQFNLSILVSDAFMSAVAEDEDWLLYHAVKPFKRDPALEVLDFYDEVVGCQAYVYAKWRARELWELITRSTYEYSEPGIIFIDRVNDLNNLYYREQIRCTNPCVTGDTLILTDQGHLPIKDLVGKEVLVYNGEGFSKVIPYSTGINSLMEITFSNGHAVRCTPYHKWVLHTGARVQAHELLPNDKLQFCEMPLIQGGHTYAIDAYSQGFYCGDGTKNATESNLYKHEESIRDRLVGKIRDRNCKDQPGHRWTHGVMLPKDFVPSEGTIEYCMAWLSGLLDADGCVSRKKDTNVLEITAKDRNFLRRIGLMLNRFGINYRIWERKDAGLKNGSNGKAYMCESTASLMISWKYVYELIQLGLNTSRVDLSPFKKAPKGIARVGHRVVSVKHLPYMEETFCLTEPVNNTFIANGVLTGNCGEQPLPPDACCNLGANNLAIMVRNPYTDDAEFDFALLGRVARIGQRFLDNVTDVTNYPLEAQRKEQMLTRRTGNGQSGLASAMAQLGIRYGSAKAARFASEVSKTIAFAAYEASAEMAKERGAFPAYDQASFWNPSANSFAVQRFKGTPLFGRPLRNGVMLTCAPNGTTSVAYGNIDSGIEPIFALEYDRKVRQPDNSYKVSKVKSFSLRLWEHLNPGEPLPKHVNTTEELQIHEHVLVQEAIQHWTDASISKTINIPESMPYEEFAKVYDLAYESGLKGCTTYRPSAVRGSILSTGTTAESSGAAATPAAAKTPLPDDIKRPDILQATIAKIRWPQMSSAAYVHLGRMEDGTPFEVFLTSKDQRNMEWMTTATLMASWLLRLGVPLKTIAEELQKIESMDGALVKGRYRPSFVSLVGHTLLEMDKANRGEEPPVEEVYTIHAAPSDETRVVAGASVRCPVCRSPNVTMRNGCISCPDCGESKCG